MSGVQGGAGEDAATAVIRQALGLASSGRIDEAIRSLRSVRNGVLRHPGGQNVLGALLMQRGQAAEALVAFEAAIAIAPGFADALCNRGVALQKLGRNGEALAAYDGALRAEPRHLNALVSRGNVLKLLGRPADAVAAFGQALAVSPNDGAIHLQRAYIHTELAAAEQALTDYTAALRLRPDLVEAAVGIASSLATLLRFEAALTASETVLASHPDNLTARTIRAQVLVELDRAGEALSDIDRAIARGAGAPAHVVRSRALWALGRRGEGIAAGKEAARLAPADAVLREGLAYLCLSTGDFERGWQEYEYRLERLDARQRKAEMATPKWSGEDPAGKRILVLTEQGIGDTLQFIRYVGLLRRRGAEVCVVVQPGLMRLMRSHAADVEWIDTVKAQGRFDFHISLLSLPGVFGTRVDAVPADVPYLSADPEAVVAWGGKIGSAGMRVGVVWQGNPKYPNDRRRSIPLRFYAPLAAIPGVRLISLQAVHGLNQLDTLPAGMSVESLGAKITDNPDGIPEIAAVMANLDLVVTSDTAMAHLAGALGRPVWVALADDPDWRWMLDRPDSPWYPTMRLFRQRERGDWARVFTTIAAALKERIATG